LQQSEPLQSSLVATASFDPGPGNVDLTLLSGDGITVLDTSASPTADTEEVSFLDSGSDSGFLFVKVDNKSDSCTPIDLKISNDCACRGDDFYELNDTLAAARLFGPGPRSGGVELVSYEHFPNDPYACVFYDMAVQSSPGEQNPLGMLTRRSSQLPTDLGTGSPFLQLGVQAVLSTGAPGGSLRARRRGW
jgi:hypothetical protein